MKLAQKNEPVWLEDKNKTRVTFMASVHVQLEPSTQNYKDYVPITTPILSENSKNNGDIKSKR